MMILLKKDMDGSLGDALLPVLKNQVLAAKQILMLLSVAAYLAACAAPTLVSVPADPPDKAPVPTRPEPKTVQSDLPAIA